MEGASHNEGAPYLEGALLNKEDTKFSEGAHM